MKNCCKLLLFCALIGSLFVACEDNYSYNDEEPPKTMLGESIYDWLKNDGHFTYYLRIVESVQDAGTNYTEVLKTTGTKTVFVADDEAFEAFFADNPYGIRSFEDFTTAQKRAIFFSCMLNDAYLIEMMSSTPGSSGAKPNQGQALRRTTAWTILDSIPFETPDRLPETSYWDSFRENGMYLMKDNSQWMMVHFLEPNMRVQGITAEDFRYLTKTKENPAGQEWDRTAAYIFNTKVIRKDITCKNGYINILEKLLLPADNIAEYIRNNNDVKLFSRLLDRYCAPFYDASSTSAYRELHPDFSERIYAKRFFTEDFNYLPDANGVTSDKKALGTLKFDIGKNAYSPDGSQGDMGAIFVPTDAAMNKYFNEGSGLLLKERYGVLDSVPDDVISLLLNNHIQKSFIQSMPDRFERLTNSMGTSLNIKKTDVLYSAICSNGAVYVVDKVYPPSDFAAVTGPVTMGEATKIMAYALKSSTAGGLDFGLYLLSLENKFSFIVPSDSVFNNYISPASIARKSPRRWKFYIKNNGLTASSWYDADGDGLLNDSLGVVSSTLVKNALQDIVDNHIVVGDIEDGKTYYKTKGGSTIKITGSGVGMQLDGGGNSAWNETVTATRIYPMENGKTYMTDKVMQTPFRSVHYVLENTPEFREFFELCKYVGEIATGKKDSKGVELYYTIFKGKNGIDENVDFFNAFDYTVYVPTNEALQAAHAAGRFKTPDEIKALSDPEEQIKEGKKLSDFLRYHFQDNSVYIGGETYTNEWFNTATIDDSGQKFRRVWVTNSNTGITVRSKETGGIEAHVDTASGLYNIMTRDYQFTSDAASATSDAALPSIAISSFAVIHRIDKVLDFQ